LGKITSGHLSRPFANRISCVAEEHTVAKMGTSKGGGKAMANYPQELA